MTTDSLSETDSTCLINIEHDQNYPSVVISQDDAFADTLLQVPTILSAWDCLSLLLYS